MKRLLIVGSGLTGCSLSFLLSRATRPEVLELAMWDKARGIGGRMSTVRSNKVPGSHVDLGAQYFSITPEYAERHREVFDMLVEEKVLVPLSVSVENQREYPEGTKHYVAPDGSASLPRHFLTQSGVTPNFRRQLSRVDLLHDSKKWSVTAQDGSNTEVDALVLTLPVPQLLALKGNFIDVFSADLIANLKKVQYSSRYALGLFYNPGTKLPGDWTSMYIDNNPCLRFISKDHEKRGRTGEAPSVTVHTGVPFGLQYINSPPSVVQTKIIDEVRACFPLMPEPVEMKFHKWRYSQVYNAFDGRPGCVVVHSDPFLILAGDAFSHTNMSGVISSAKAVHAELARLMPAEVSA